MGAVVWSSKCEMQSNGKWQLADSSLHGQGKA